MDEDSSLEEFTTGTTGDGAGAERTGESGGSTPNPDAEPDAETDLGSSTTGGENSGAGDDPESEADSGGAVTPTVSTYGYTPEKETCGACGTRVRRRWRDDDGLVCSECKEW